MQRGVYSLLDNSFLLLCQASEFKLLEEVVSSAQTEESHSNSNATAGARLAEVRQNLLVCANGLIAFVKHPCQIHFLSWLCVLFTTVHCAEVRGESHASSRSGESSSQ